jgi:hypothetical protein
MRWNRDHEVEAGQDRREAGDEHADPGHHHVAARGAAAVRRIEGPAGIDAARDHRVEREQEAEHEHVPAQEIDLWEGDVLRTEHERQHEVAEDRGHGRNQDEEHHRHAVHREQLVVGVGAHQVARGCRQLHADQRGEDPADEEREADDAEVHDADAFVVLGQEPRRDRVLMVEIGDARCG